MHASWKVLGPATADTTNLGFPFTWYIFIVQILDKLWVARHPHTISTK